MPPRKPGRDAIHKPGMSAERRRTRGSTPGPTARPSRNAGSGAGPAQSRALPPPPLKRSGVRSWRRTASPRAAARRIRSGPVRASRPRDAPSRGARRARGSSPRARSALRSARAADPRGTGHAGTSRERGRRGRGASARAGVGGRDARGGAHSGAARGGAVSAGEVERPSSAAALAGLCSIPTAASVLAVRSALRRVRDRGRRALFGQLPHCVRRAFARVAGVLDAAVGHLVGAEGGRLVDRDAAELEPPGALERRLDVAGEDAAWRP